jgi:hypothetical protein
MSGLAALAVLVGCGTAESQGESMPAVRDSAGISIVEPRASEPKPAQWAVDTEPYWLVGELEGQTEYLFSRIAGALDLGDGRVVVADGGTNELRFFDDDGQWIESLGGEGQGPGEFEYIRALDFCYPDGFVAFDLNWQKNNYLMDGTFVEKTVLRVPSGITPYSLACDSGGNVLMLGWGRDGSGGPIIGFHQAYDQLLLTDAEGEIQADLGERLSSERIGSQYGSRPHPAGRATRMALHDGLMFVGSGESFEVEVRSLDGTLTHLLRGPQISLEVTEPMKDAYLQGQLARAEDATRRASLRSQIEGWEWPATAPAFTELMVDGAGVVWVKRFSIEPDTNETWSLLDMDRGYLGYIELGAGQELLSIGDEDLLVRIIDEFDVERVGKLALDRGNNS